jgi:hypothetical protein
MAFLRKLRSLRPAGRRLLVQSACLLPLVSLGVRVLGLRRVQALLNASACRLATPSGHQMLDVRRALRVVRCLGSDGPFRGNCLSRSLVLCWLLRRRGIQCELRIGVDRKAADFRAHAWVEVDGIPLNAGREVHERFAVFEDPVA